MNSPIDYIEEGIRSGDWETVCEGFERLTGKSVPPPSVDGLVNTMQKIHDITSSALGLDLIAEICVKEEEGTNKKKKTVKKTKKTKKKKAPTISKEGEDSSIVLQDTNRTPGPREAGTVQYITNIPDPKEVERNKEKAARTDRANFEQRPVSIKFKVECNECLKDFQSDRRKGKMGQKCPKCMNSRRSQFG